MFWTSYSFDYLICSYCTYCMYVCPDYISPIQDSGLLPKGDLANQFKPVVPWPHVEGVEVDLNSIRLKNGESHFYFKNWVQISHQGWIVVCQYSD